MHLPDSRLRPFRGKWLWAMLGLALLLPPAGAHAAENLIVAAAASLHKAFRDVAEGFEKESGIHTTLVFGASGSLAHQIENGAPYDVFASADLRWLRRLIEGGHLRPGSLVHYAEGSLALVARRPEVLVGLPEELDANALKRVLGPGAAVIAIANPERAPYGLAARETLEAAALWTLLRNRLVYGDNVRQTLTYVETGNAEAAFVAEALLVGIPDAPAWKRVSGGLHRPIRQGLGIVTRSPNLDEARRFSMFLTGPAGTAILHRHGFRLPAIPSGAPR